MAKRGGDPDLRLIVDGRTVRARANAADVAAFSVPAGARAVRVVSRSLVPAAIDPTAADRRRLGVSVRRISFRSPHLDLDIPPNDPALADGWHAPEDGHRWTNGAAVLPPELLRGFNEPLTLELHLNPVQLDHATR